MIIGIDASRANKPIKTGTEWYAYNLIEHLKKIIPASVTVRLYTSSPLIGSLGEVPANWEICLLRWPLPYFWTTIRLAVEMIMRPPDVLFLPCSGFPLRLPRSVVTTIHDIGFDRFPELYKPIQVYYHKHAVRRALKRCRIILTISEFTRQELKDVYGTIKPAVQVTPLAADEKKFYYPIADEEIRRMKENYKLDRPYFLYIGRVESKKNIGRLLKAFALVGRVGREAELVLVGPDGRGSEALTDLLGGVKRIKWLADKDLAPVLAGALALVFPTLYEGFGIPIVEAMAVGTPVLTSDRGANKEVAGDAAILVDPEDVRSIADGLVQISRNSDLRQSLITKGLARSRQFDWDKTANLTWLAISDAATKGNGLSP